MAYVMTESDIRHWLPFLRRVRYKKDYKFYIPEINAIDQSLPKRVTLMIENLPNSRKDETMPRLRYGKPLPWVNEAEALREIHQMLFEWETHELYEWFRLDKELVFDPDAPGQGPVVDRQEIDNMFIQIHTPQLVY